MQIKLTALYFMRAGWQTAGAGTRTKCPQTKDTGRNVPEQ